MEGRTLRVSGGFVDPRTGEGRVVHRGGRVIRLTPRRVRSVRTAGLVTRVVARSGARLRLRLAQLLFTGGTTTLTLDPSLGFGAREATYRITSGLLDARTLAGEVGSHGSMDLAEVALIDVAFLPGVGINAQVGDFRPVIGTVAPQRPAIRGLRVTFRPAPVALTAIAAQRLNFYFQTDRYREGMPLGTLAVRGRLRG